MAEIRGILKTSGKKIRPRAESKYVGFNAVNEVDESAEIRGILKSGDQKPRTRAESKYVGFNTENEEDESAAFALKLTDVVTKITIIQGEAFVGPFGKPHPNFDLQLVGALSLRRR